MEPAAPRTDGVPRDDRPRHHAPRLVAQKKTLRARERDEAARAAFRTLLLTRPADDFVVIDECGSNLDLTPRYARAPHNERAFGSVPRNTPANTTLIASLHLQGMGPAMVLRGATDTLAFDAYVRQALAPTLRAILDNLSAHKSPRIAEAIDARGCELWFLPSYSPNFSPIEQAFAKLKNQWRQAEARTPEALLDAVSSSLPSISTQDALGFFRDGGFRMDANQGQRI